jgi:hypothetical protein
MDSVIERLENLQYKYEDTLLDRDNKIDHLTNQLEIQQQTVRDYQLIILELNKLIMKNDKKMKKLKKEKKYYKSLVQQQHSVIIDLTNDHHDDHDHPEEPKLKEIKQEPKPKEPIPETKAEPISETRPEPRPEPILKIKSELRPEPIVIKEIEVVAKEVQPELTKEIEEGEIVEEESQTDFEDEEPEDDVDEEEVDEEEVEEEEVFEIKIKGKTYYTNNETIGSIYAEDENGDIGEEVGKFKNGIPVMYSKK